MRMIGLVALAIVLGGASTEALAAQEVPDDAPVVAAAVTDLLQQLRTNDGVREGTFRYDARLLERRVFDRPGQPPAPYYALGEQENGSAEAVRADVGAQRGDMESSVVCANESPGVAACKTP